VKCPSCGHPESKVLDSRPTEEGAIIRRRRECLACGERFTTYERVEARPLVVVKKDGRREAFDANKVLRGLLTACEKRPVPVATLEAMAGEVERELRGRFEREVPSREIGEIVMRRLQGLDQVAYVRFASVYRQFQDLARFKEELERLLSSGDGGR
jgi:transcriptional repressor NrdR